ncbi:MAG: T9SS type A sorting domain-containing protein, partial [Thaumarchaeota archaeon]|nr:T9SS type A sorting domain-containing protein [Nitrososphaerota archaeon]
RMSKGVGASVGYINGLVITSYAGDPTIFYPGDLTAQALDGSSIRLSWSDNSFNEQGFMVYRSTSKNGSYEMIGTTGANETSYIDGGLSAGSIYYYKLRAYFRGGTYSDYTESVASGTISYYIYVNINGVPQYDADIPWNNLSVTASTGDVFTGFKNQNGVQTGMYMTVEQGMQGSNDWGATTGDDSGIYPDNVTKSFYFNDRFDPKGIFTLRGLDLSYNYNLKFFGSIVTNYDIVTNFSSQGWTVSNHQTNNLSEVSGIYGLEANADGEIEFTVQEAGNSTWAIFNAFVLEAYPKETVDIFARNAGGSASSVVGDYQVRFGKSHVKLSYYPNPASGYFNIVIEEAPAVEAKITMVDLMGREVFSKQQFLNEINTEIRIEGELNGLQPGMYLFNVQIGTESHTNRIVIK